MNDLFVKLLCNVERRLPFRALILASFKIERVKNGLVSLKGKKHGEEKTSCKELRRGGCSWNGHGK